MERMLICTEPMQSTAWLYKALAIDVGAQTVQLTGLLSFQSMTNKPYTIGVATAPAYAADVVYIIACGWALNSRSCLQYMLQPHMQVDS